MRQLKLTTVNILSDSHGRHINKTMNEEYHSEFKTVGYIKANARIKNILNNTKCLIANFGKQDYVV